MPNPADFKARPLEGCCDLHTHSTCSDGTASPSEIVAQARLLGLSAVALTDHNTLSGLPEFLEAARGSGLLAIPGVEISTGYLGKELHIVGLFLPAERFGEINDYLTIIRHRKEQSNRITIQNLRQAGFDLDYDQIVADHGNPNVNRAVIAAALLKKGYITHPDEAFSGVLASKNGFVHTPERVDVFDTIRFLASVGAVPVLAHPFLKLSEAQLRVFLPEAKRHGLAAMETLYSTFTPEQTACAISLAEEFGLLQSGGSDCHGDVKPDISLGTGRGNLYVPVRFATDLMPK